MYLLTVAKNGPKLKPADKPPDDAEKLADAREKAISAMAVRMENVKKTGMHYRGIQFANATVGEFAEGLSNRLDYPVRDMTSLEGQYSFSMQWVYDPSHPLKESDDTARGISIFEAIQEQLGLSLRLDKTPGEILIIDKAEKSPTGN